MAALLVACGGDSVPAGTIDTPSTTTSTLAATRPTTTPLPPDIAELGFPVSDEWVVETVARNIDGGTGGLAVDDQGTIFMGDFGYATNTGAGIYRISPNGEVEVFSDADRMEQLTTTKIAPDGSIYQSSYGSNRVFRVEEDGTATVVTDDIIGPTGIVVLEDGTLIVASWSQGIIHKVHPDGTVEDWVGRHPAFNGINSLTVGPDGTVYVVNIRDGGLFAVDQAGQVTELELYPRANSHVAYDSGSLFVTSRGGYVILRYDLETGETEIIAGNGIPGDQDGRGIEASFGRPNAIAVGPEGVLYFNHTEGRNDTPVHIKKLSHQP
jgi:sugar lactone lactonase YvrE